MNRNKSPFQDAILYVSARSPYARRVRLAFQESGLRHDERVIDVWKPNAELISHNPLSRVPTVVFADGSVLAESHLILAAYYESAENSLRPRDWTWGERIKADYWSGLAIGVVDKTVENFLETLRHPEHRDPELIDEANGAITRFLEKLEREIGDWETVVPGRLTQADLDLGTALAYLELRYSPEALRDFPQSKQYLDRLNQRPSFQKTRPPQA